MPSQIAMLGRKSFILAGLILTLCVPVPATTLNVSADATAYRDNDGLEAGVRYYYRVRAVRDGGNCPTTSDWSNEDDAIPRCPSTAAPTGLNAARDNATPAADVVLTWNDNSSDETRFQIQRKRGAAGTWAPIADVPADATSYRDDNNLVKGTTYWYRVRAVRDGGDCQDSSDWSNEEAANP